MLVVSLLLDQCVEETRSATRFPLHTGQSRHPIMDRYQLMLDQIDRQGAVNTAGYGILIHTDRRGEKP